MIEKDQSWIEPFLEQYHCDHCGNTGKDGFYYSWSYSDGEIWICKKCESEIHIETEDNEN